MGEDLAGDLRHSALLLGYANTRIFLTIVERARMAGQFERAAAELERLQAREAELVGALGLYERVTTSHVDGRDLLEELQPSAWHYCDIVVRIGGKDCRFLGDWLKGVWYARKNARVLTAARQEPSHG